MTVHNEPAAPAAPAGPAAAKRVIAVPVPVHDWIKEQAELETVRRGRTFTQPEVIERLVEHWKRTGGRWDG